MNEASFTQVLVYAFIAAVCFIVGVVGITNYRYRKNHRDD